MPTHHHHHDNPSPPPPKPNPKLLCLLLKSIIMALILSLFLLFLGLTTLALLHLLLATSSLHRRRPRRPTSSHSSYSPEDLQKHLPRLKYAAVSTPKDCAVCLEGFKEGEWCRTLPDCTHIFHLICIDRWLTKVPNCPICRAPVRLNSGGSGSIISDDDCKILWAVGV